MDRYAIICPACAVTVARADDPALAEEIRKAAEHGDIDPSQEPYVHDDACSECGGAADSIRGCAACCRDCGRPCSFEKDGEGFHAEDAE